MDYTYIKGKIRPWRSEEKEKYFSKKKKKGENKGNEILEVYCTG